MASNGDNLLNRVTVAANNLLHEDIEDLDIDLPFRTYTVTTVTTPTAVAVSTVFTIGGGATEDQETKSFDVGGLGEEASLDELVAHRA